MEQQGQLDVEKALGTPAREQLQQDADRATYERRALAVECERAIAENELQNKIELARRRSSLLPSGAPTPGARPRKPPPARLRCNPGVLVPHPPQAAPALLAAAGRPGAAASAAQLAMVEVVTDDGQSLTALNEIYIGQPSHQTARYTLTTPGGQCEAQASSGLIVSTGTGATGWCRSVWLERHSSLRLPASAEPRLAWFVREAWPSAASGTSCTEDIGGSQSLQITAESDELVIFGDGMEPDAVRAGVGPDRSPAGGQPDTRAAHAACPRGPGAAIPGA